MNVCHPTSCDETTEMNLCHHCHPTSFDEVSPKGGVCEPTEDPCIGGFARLYTAITQALEDEPDSLLLNGGDSFQGTIWYNFLRWNVTQHFMNMLPHDAHVSLEWSLQYYFVLVAHDVLPATDSSATYWVKL